MNTISNHIIFLLAMGLVFMSCHPDSFTPEIDSIDPEFGPEETLVVFEGSNLGDIQSITFSGKEINFNSAYNADHAFLLRIPASVPLGDHEVVLTTAGGSATTRFRVTEEAPEVFEIFPESAAPGEEVVIRGENFFEPVRVYFFDSIQANIVRLAEDSIVVTVPEGIERGYVRVIANGGSVLSPKRFFTINTIWVNDFDGKGLRAETNKWIFQGSLNENALNAVQNSDPTPINGNFLKLSGKDDLGIQWIGGAQSNLGFPGDTFETFGIVANDAQTLLELDANNNGQDHTHIILILQEKDGSTNDFTQEIHVDWEGWGKISIPLSRFRDLNDVAVDPQKVKLIKVHLIDKDNTGTTLEINVDNIRFTELL